MFDKVAQFPETTFSKHKTEVCITNTTCCICKDFGKLGSKDVFIFFKGQSKEPFISQV